MYELLLTIHIIGAVIFFLLSGISVFSLLRKNIKLNKNLFILVSTSSISQILQGTFLGIVSGGSIFSICSKVGIYLFLSIILLTSLYFGSFRKESLILQPNIEVEEIL